MNVLDLDIEVTRKSVKNISLYIIPPNGDIRITAPKRVSENEIKRFVISKYDWIINSQNRVKQRVTDNCSFNNGDLVLLWGKEYTLNIKASNNFSVDVFDECIVIYTKSTDKAVIEKRFNEWYRNQLSTKIEELLPIWEQRTGLKCSSWQIRNMKTRWGSCNTKTNKINLNLQLVKRPVECLEYVILHELAHTIVPNHSNEFKAVLRRYMPDWKNVQRELNNYNL